MRTLLLTLVLVALGLGAVLPAAAADAANATTLDPPTPSTGPGHAGPSSDPTTPCRPYCGPT